jgi:hypothetical protein
VTQVLTKQYISEYTHTRARTRTHTRTHTYTHPHTHTHARTRIHTNTHTHAHTYTHALTHAHKYTHTHTRMHTYTHAHTYTHTLTRTHTYTYTHVLFVAVQSEPRTIPALLEARFSNGVHSATKAVTVLFLRIQCETQRLNHNTRFLWHLLYMSCSGYKVVILIFCYFVCWM